MDTLNNYYSQDLKNASIISILFLSVLLLASFFLYPLRMSFIDAPFMIFQIIQKETPDIMVERYGSIVTQIFPYIGYKLGLSLASIMLLYSMSFNLFYLISALLLFKIKEYAWIIVLTMYQIAFATDSYFWTNNEIHQGIAWLTLTFGFWSYFERLKSLNGFRIFIIVFMGAVSVFTHPLIIPVLIFIVIFLVLNGKLNLKIYKDQLIILTCILLCVIKLIFSSYNWYDGGKFNQLTSHSISDWLTIFEKPVFKAFFNELIVNHWVAIILTLINILVLLKTRQFLILIFELLFILSYLMVTAMMFPEFVRFYIESQWMPIAVFLSLPIVFNLKKSSALKLLPFAVLFVCIIWVANMIRPYNLFAERYALHNTILNKMESKNLSKAIITDVDEAVKKKMIMPWGLPVESLILSSSINSPKLRTFLFDQPERLPSDASMFLSCFENIPCSKLNQTYFKLDTINKYKVIKMNELFD